jgi:hypothetical protein
VKRAETCPNAAQHTPEPAGYLAWYEWARRMAKTHRQTRCHVCHRWKVWVPK